MIIIPVAWFGGLARVLSMVEMGFGLMNLDVRVCYLRWPKAVGCRAKIAMSLTPRQIGTHAKPQRSTQQTDTTNSAQQQRHPAEDPPNPAEDPPTRQRTHQTRQRTHQTRQRTHQTRQRTHQDSTKPTKTAHDTRNQDARNQGDTQPRDTEQRIWILPFVDGLRLWLQGFVWLFFVWF